MLRNYVMYINNWSYFYNLDLAYKIEYGKFYDRGWEQTHSITFYFWYKDKDNQSTFSVDKLRQPHEYNQAIQFLEEKGII